LNQGTVKKEKTMQFMRWTVLLALLMITFGGCAQESTKSPDVAGDVRSALDHAALGDVRVSEDRDKGVVTLTGQVRSGDEKSQAEAIAKSIAAGQVVSNEVAVVPPGDKDAKAINSDLDGGIDKNFDAALLRHRLNKVVKYDVKNGVVTLKGEVKSDGRRMEVQRLAASIPNVTQVINELDVKNQKATASN
jgi:hyperosmotically inducible protein